MSNYKWQISEKGRDFLFACDYCTATQRNVSLRYASAKNDYLLSRDGRQKTFNAEMKKPELAFKRFIRFLLARAAMTWGVELMAGAFRVYQFYRQGRMGRVIIMKNAAKGGGGGMTDEALYRRYLGGDEDALGALMERYGTKLTLYLDGYLCDLHEAEDLMIEAFAYLIAKRPAIRDGGFRAYLYQSARHMARLAAAQKAGEELLLPGRADGGTGGPGAGGGNRAVGRTGAAPADLHGRAARGLPGGAVPCLF